MQRQVGIMALAAAALAWLCQSADAGPRNRLDPRVNAASIVVGAGSTAGYFALTNWRWRSNWNHHHRGHGLTTGGAFAATTIGCMVLSPMVATAFAGRELTYREVHVMGASCVIPIVGGWLMSMAYDANPQWERFDKPQPAQAPQRKRRR